MSTLRWSMSMSTGTTRIINTTTTARSRPARATAIRTSMRRWFTHIRITRTRTTGTGIDATAMAIFCDDSCSVVDQLFFFRIIHASHDKPRHTMIATLRLFALPLAICAALAQSAIGSETQLAVDADTGAQSWKTHSHGVALSLTQILPDQARAFYLNRGFPAEVAELYATSCVFMAVLRNDAASGTVGFRLADWSLTAAGGARPPRPVDDWLAEWRRRGLSEAAVIAFRWAQFPPEQEYEPGDWNQGMLSAGLSPGSTFTLTARWQVAGKTYEGKLSDVHCPR